MFIHLNPLYIGRDIELYALVPHSYLLLLKKRRPVRGLTLKRLYIGSYGTFKFKLSCIFIYVWIVNFHGYRLVSTKVWRKCFAAVWRRIYSSKFAYFGNIYRHVFICICNNSVITVHDCINDYTTILCIWNHAKRMFIHLNRLYNGRDIELYALVPHHYNRGGRFGFWSSNVYKLVNMGPWNVNDHTFLDMYG